MMHRRQFIERSALALAASAISTRAAGQEAAATSSRPRLAFTKGLEKVPFDELAEKIAALGATGLEAPIRKGGHIEPEQVPDKLPEFVAALKKQKLELGILTSDITKADKGAETLLRAAVAQGIKRYRLGPYFYDLKKPIAPQLEEVRAKLKDLAAMNKELGIQGQFQNHRGNNRVGSPLWDLIEALEGIDPAQMGIAFDFAHATVEGQNAWELNLRRAAPHVVAVYFKDYKLEGREWMPCSLGEGCVTEKAAAVVKQVLPADIPVSCHVEYIEGNEKVARIFEAMKKDLGTVKGWLG